MIINSIIAQSCGTNFRIGTLQFNTVTGEGDNILIIAKFIDNIEFISGGWCLVQCFSLFSDVKTVSETTTQNLLPDYIQQNDHKSRSIEEKSVNKEIHINDLTDKAELVSRIEILENEQTNQMV